MWEFFKLVWGKFFMVDLKNKELDKIGQVIVMQAPQTVFIGRVFHIQITWYKLQINNAGTDHWPFINL